MAGARAMIVTTKRPSACLTLSLALALAGCGAEETPTDGALGLSRAASGPASKPVVIQTVLVPEDLAAWTLEAPSATVFAIPGTRGVRLQGGETQQVHIPGAFDSDLFDAAEVELIAAQDVSLRLGLERSAAPPAHTGSPDVRFVLAGSRARVLFDLRNVSGEGGTFDELQIFARGKEPDWTLLAVRLLKLPVESWLPEPEGGGNMVPIGGEGRRAVGLSAGAPLGTSVLVPEGGRLTFSWAPAPGHQRPDPACRLRVRAGGQELLTHEPAGGWDSVTDWQRFELDLSALAGLQVDLEFELLGEGASESLLALAEPALFEPRLAPTTVLLVTSDTHRADHLGAAMSGVDVLTPTLDALAEEGVLFEDCFSPSNITLPSHASILTGLNPRDTGIINNRTRLAERADTLAERFREAGYATYAVVSAKHMRHAWSGFGQGFDRMSWPDAERERPAEESIALLEGWLDEGVDRPLFIWLHLYDAHRPYAPPQGYLNAYYPKKRNPRDPKLPRLESPLPPHLKGVRDIRYIEALYKGEVSYLDLSLAHLMKRERFEEAIVAVVGDHGESFGEQGLWWDHVGVYPSVLHVPLILRWPGAPRGARIAQSVRHFDLGRTLLALAGVDPGGFPGQDLREALGAAPAEALPRFALGSDGHALAANLDRWHFVVNLHEGDVNPLLTTSSLLEEHALELFDTEVDPDCQHDLSKPAHLQTTLLARALLRWIENPRGSLAEINASDPETDDMLRALGYASGGGGGVGELVDIELLKERLGPFLGDQ